MQKWVKLRSVGLLAVTLLGVSDTFCQSRELPEAPKPKVVDRRFVAVYGLLGASKAADMFTTSQLVSRGCWETNPIFGGRHPSDRRLALTAAGYFAGEVALGYAVKRWGRGHRWAKALWLIEPGRQTAEHITFAVHNSELSCRR